MFLIFSFLLIKCEIPIEISENSLNTENTNISKGEKKLSFKLKEEAIENMKKEAIDQIKDNLKEEAIEQIKEEAIEDIKEEAIEDIKKEAIEDIKKDLVKDIIKEKLIIKKEEEKNKNIKYPFGIIDMSNLRNNTYSIANNKPVTRRMNMNPFFNLQLNKNESNPGIEIYEIERLLNNYMMSTFHPTVGSKKVDILNKIIFGMKNEGDLYTILSLYLKSAASLNINKSNVLVLPDEYFIDSSEDIINGNIENINLIKLNEFKNSLKEIRRKLLEVLHSINMYPLYCMPSSTLQLSENQTSSNEFFNINYSRELATISFIKDNKIKRWFYYSKFSSRNFKNKFIKLMKQSVIKSNKNTNYNILIDYKGYNPEKINIIFINDIDYGLFSTPQKLDNSLKIEDLKYSILPINELIDTFLININTYKFRLAIYDYPITNHNSFQTKNKISAGMLPFIELDMSDLRKELSNEFNIEINDMIEFIKQKEEYKLLKKPSIIISPFPSNIVYYHIKYIKSQLNLIKDNSIKISYPIPSQTFEYKEDKHIQFIDSIDSKKLKKESELILHEISINKKYSELIKKIRSCKYVEFLPLLRKIKKELKQYKSISDIFNFKTKSIKEMNDLIKSDYIITQDYKQFNSQLQKFNQSYKAYLNNTEMSILGSDILKEYELLIKDDYYKGEERKKSIIAKHMEEFIIKMKGIEKEIENQKKEITKEALNEEKVVNKENETNKINSSYINKLKDLFKTEKKDEKTEEEKTEEENKVEKEINKVLKEMNFHQNSNIEL